MAKRSTIVLVEYHSGGKAAAQAEWALEHGHDCAVADNSATYHGPGSVVTTGANVGFGAACNRVVESLGATPGAIVLMNPDVTLDPAGLDQLVDRVRSGEFDVLAPASVSAHGRTLGFSRPSPWREPLVTLREQGRLRGDTQHIASPGHGGASGAAGTDLRERAPEKRFGSAALLVVKPEAFRAVGGFDERYFLYVEDADLWERLERSGVRLGFDPSVEIKHESSTGSRGSRHLRASLRRLGIELYLADRRRPIRHLRCLHRLTLPDPEKTDDLLWVLRRGYERAWSAAEIQAMLRSRAAELG